MVAFDEREQQALNIIRALSPERQRMILYELAKNTEEQWRLNSIYAEQQLREIASKRGKIGT
jgi:16S rRNA C1402 (ribose-2'-O) methylase RsmI